MQEDIILTTAITVANKKYTTDEEALIHLLGKPNAKIDVILPDDMDAETFDTALSAVSKVLVRATMQREAMFPILGRLLHVAEEHPDLWNKKFERFEDFRLSLAERFGLGRQTSYDALDYARRWAGVLPPNEYKSVGRVKLRMISRAVGKGDEGKATARKLLDFAREGTAEQLDEHMDKLLHTGKGSTTGAYFKFPCSKKDLKVFQAWFNNPLVQAKVGSDKWSVVLDCMIAECEGGSAWLDEGQRIVDSKAQEQAPEQPAA